MVEADEWPGSLAVAMIPTERGWAAGRLPSSMGRVYGPNLRRNEGQMSEQRKRVTAITTVWRKDSHADVIIPKLLAGYDLDGQPVRPAVDIVSLYVDQVPENDLSRRWAR